MADYSIMKPVGATPTASSVSGTPPPDAIIMDPEPLSEDLYGVGIASLLRDSRQIVCGTGQMGLRISRMSVTSVLLLLTVVMQVFLLFQFRRLVTSHAVHDIRVKYGNYEQHMYNGNIFKTVNGFDRGLDGFFDIKQFASMDFKLKKSVCEIPLSQPSFLAVILAIWSFTVVIDLRRVQFLADLLIWRTPTCADFTDMLSWQGEGQEVTLEGVPISMKVLLVFMMFLPRMAIDIVLLWLGCRWLVATHSFSDVLLNAMALEFILLLKDLMYEAVVPNRDKFDTRMLFVPQRIKSQPNYCEFLGSFLWLIIVLVWVWVYMYHLQMVLPHYKWDVHLACEGFLAEITVV